MKNKVAYFNCTANQAHIGCYAVTDAHFRMLLKNGYDIIYISPLNELQKFKAESRVETVENIENSYINNIVLESDAIIINGEGTIHHGGGTTLLCLAELAMKKDKLVFIVNSVIQEVDGYDDILSKVKDLNVREIRSSNYLKSKNIRHRVVLDTILEANFNKMKSLDFKNKIVFTDWHKQRDYDVGKQITQYERTHRKDIIFFPIHHLYHIQNDNWRGIIESLSEAKLVITGRHHGIYLAGLAGVPIVALPSNTHKVEGTLDMSPVKIAFCGQDDILEEKIQYALANLHIAKEFQKYLKSQQPLSTFDKLYELLPTSVSFSDEEVHNKIQEYFSDLIDITVENEIKNSYKPLQLRVHQSNLIQSLKTKEQKLLQKVKITEDRIIKLREIKLKLESSNKNLKINQQASREQLVVKSEKVKELNDSWKKRYKVLHENYLLSREQLIARNKKITELNSSLKTINIDNEKLSKYAKMENSDDKLISDFMYKEWLDINEQKALVSNDNNLKLQLAMSYHGILDYNKAISIWLSLLTVHPEIANKNLARIYIELNYLNGDTTVFKQWNEKFALLLANQNYIEAWEYILERPKTKTCLSSNKHFLMNENTSEKVLILPDGGIGDELRNSVIYQELFDMHSNIIIACEKRLYQIFKSTFPQIDFLIYSQEVESSYNVICSVYELFHKISPFSKKYNFLKGNHNLLGYWEEYLKNKSCGKKIIGICQGTHIHSFDRMSNIFEYAIWADKLNEDYLFVNLSLEYIENKNENILVLPINYHDDFDTLAAVILCCDFVITPANTILDFAGSLGKKTIALYTGYKFHWRIDEDGHDKIHINTKWIGSNTIGNKEDILELAFSYLKEELLKCNNYKVL